MLELETGWSAHLSIVPAPSNGVHVLWIAAVGCLIIHAIQVNYVQALDGPYACRSEVVDVGVCCGQCKHSLCATRAKTADEIGWYRGLFTARDKPLSLSVELGGILRRVCMRKVNCCARSLRISGTRVK